MIHPTALLAFAAQLREQARAALQAPGRQDPTALRALMQALDITADRLAAGPPRRPAPTRRPSVVRWST